MLLACQGQLRLAPSGHVIGIDMDAALRLAAPAAATSRCSRNCCRRPRLGWSRRCVAIEFGMTGFDQRPAMSADCPLAGHFDCTLVTSGSVKGFGCRPVVT